jgi:hypothetical protein
MQVAEFSIGCLEYPIEEQRGAAPRVQVATRGTPAGMSEASSIAALIPPEVEAVPAEYRAGVADQLVALREQARLVEEFALPDELEPAPVFTP